MLGKYFKNFLNYYYYYYYSYSKCDLFLKIEFSSSYFANDAILPNKSRDGIFIGIAVKRRAPRSGW